MQALLLLGMIKQSPRQTISRCIKTYALTTKHHYENHACYRTIHTFISNKLTSLVKSKL